MWKLILRRGAKLLALLLAPVAAYLLAALVGTLLPTNRDWQEAKQGVTIFIETNGVHTWVVVPTVNAEMDWRPMLPAEHIRDLRYAGNYIAIGFGNRDFYLNTPTWGDLSLKTAAAALIGGGPTLMHVIHEWNPTPNEYQRPIRLSRDQYRRLVRYLNAGFALRDGKTIPLIGRGYGPSDVFYESRLSYNLGNTCNEWTGEALRAAGVKTGVWTPFAQSIMWRMPAAPERAVSPT